ncbi:hypothetical protein AB0D04_27030 [Streptomyces sp. NPDC048483]|uniref:hypothetical protein n=1 Tax=Streptomyces sp. NPDC048483 TaxID=3154927 RepID=UPI0034358CDA
MGRQRMQDCRHQISRHPVAGSQCEADVELPVINTALEARAKALGTSRPCL